MEKKLVDGDVLSALLSDLGGNEAPVKDLIETYLEEFPKIVARLRNGIAQQRPKEVAQGAHSLKSMSALVGAMRVSHLALELESIEERGDFAEAARNVSLIESVSPAVERLLRQWPRA